MNSELSKQMRGLVDHVEALDATIKDLQPKLVSADKSLEAASKEAYDLGFKDGVASAGGGGTPQEPQEPQQPEVPVEQPPVVEPELPPVEEVPVEQPPVEQPPVEEIPVEQPEVPVEEPSEEKIYSQAEADAMIQAVVEPLLEQIAQLETQLADAQDEKASAVATFKQELIAKMEAQQATETESEKAILDFLKQ